MRGGGRWLSNWSIGTYETELLDAKTMCGRFAVWLSEYPVK